MSAPLIHTRAHTSTDDHTYVQNRSNWGNKAELRFHITQNEENKVEAALKAYSHTHTYNNLRIVDDDLYAMCEKRLKPTAAAAGTKTITKTPKEQIL